MDGDCDVGGAGGPCRVSQGVAEGVGERVVCCPQRLQRGIAVVHCIGVAAVGIKHEAAVVAGLGHAQAAATDGGDGLAVIRV